MGNFAYRSCSHLLRNTSRLNIVLNTTSSSAAFFEWLWIRRLRDEIPEDTVIMDINYYPETLELIGEWNRGHLRTDYQCGSGITFLKGEDVVMIKYDGIGWYFRGEES